MQVTSHPLCHSLLIRRESLGKPTVNRRGLHKVCVPGDRDHRGPSCRLPRIPCAIKMGVIPFGCKPGCYNKKFKYSDLHGIEVWFSLTTQQNSASLPWWRSPCLSRVLESRVLSFCCSAMPPGYRSSPQWVKTGLLSSSFQSLRMKKKRIRTKSNLF